MSRKLILAAITIACVVGVVAAQDKAPEQTGTVIKHGTIQNTSAASGKEMYTSYCAVCHGADGKGAGPAASALKIAPADLTKLSANNGGKYPALKVASSIRGESPLPAHGTREMPMWGQLFWSVSGGHEAEVQQRVTNLTKYVESLQAK